MAGTFNWSQTVGAYPGVRQDLGSSGNLFDFKSIDTIGTSDYATNPIRAGNNSYEVMLQAHLTGSFTAVYDMRFWMNTNFSPSTGLTVRAKTNQATYTKPSALTSSLATSVVPTSDPGSANVTISGSLSSSLTTSGYSDIIVLQLQTTTAAPAGDTSLASFTISYIEV